MKQCFLALSSALILTSCAGVHVSKTYIATGATDPKAIYIRPFLVSQAIVKGDPGNAERAIRKSLAPAEFANDLQEEMCKIAPATVLKSDEIAKCGWLVEGEFEVIKAGRGAGRTFSFFTGAAGSEVILHVRVIDVERRGEGAGGKDVTSEEMGGATRAGRIIYEFDVAGGSERTDALGSITAPGLGYATPFDFRNAAERIAMTLTPDPHRYGLRTSPTIR